MKHKIIIWSKRIEGAKSYIVEEHIEITAEQIEEFAIEGYKKSHVTNDNREYWAEIEESVF